MPSKDLPSASSSPPWLRQLARGLQRYGVPLLEASCGHGVLRMVIGVEGKEPLVAQLRPGSDGARGWGSAGRFLLGYQGKERLGREREGWMTATLEVIRQLEHVLPEELDKPGALFLRQVHPEERFRKSFPFCDVERSIVAGREEVEVLLRATSLCNQECPFCSAAPRLAAPEDSVRECIEQASLVYPGCLLSITGGEPTLRPGFSAEVEQALKLEGVGQVQVQTNGVAFAGKIDPASMPARPDLVFFVSLHALDEELYDRCTATTGQLPRAVAGIRRLMEAGHGVTINCVVQSINLEHLISYVEALPGTFAMDERSTLHFSVLICPEYRPEAADYLVPYSRLAPGLEAAAERGAALGLRVDPLRSSTHAAVPACVLSEEYRHHDPHRPHVFAGETGYEDLSLPWVKAERCRGCAEDPWCLGFPAAYARRFGLDEPKPL